MGPPWGSNFYIGIYREVKKNHSGRKTETCIEASSGGVDSKLVQIIIFKGGVRSQLGMKFLKT